MDFFSTSRPSEITCLELGSATQYLKNRSALNIFHEIISSILKSQKCYANEKSSFLHLKLQGFLNKNNTTTSNKNKTGFFFRVDGTGGPRGHKPPHLFWIYIVKISKFLRFGIKCPP